MAAIGSQPSLKRSSRTRLLPPDAQRARTLTATDQALIAQAIHCLERHYLVKQNVLTSPEATRDYLKLRLAGLAYEVFSVLFLDNRHRVIVYEELFRGTLDGASVHPREVVRRVIETNAAAVIFAHNHPSGVAEPSQSDLRLTQRLTDALALLDVRVLDHIIIGDSAGVSFAERGLL
ncbi:RadC family protein [Thiocystis minor]|uniref:RadC family protein n=1 Tax=Thiocystis minor TaxID=61597 RepID=UPI0019143455